MLSEYLLSGGVRIPIVALRRSRRGVFPIVALGRSPGRFSHCLPLPCAPSMGQRPPSIVGKRPLSIVGEPCCGGGRFFFFSMGQRPLSIVGETPPFHGATPLFQPQQEFLRFYYLCPVFHTFSLFRGSLQLACG